MAHYHNIIDSIVNITILVLMSIYLSTEEFRVQSRGRGEVGISRGASNGCSFNPKVINTFGKPAVACQKSTQKGYPHNLLA